jgi:hypothetical protein
MPRSYRADPNAAAAKIAVGVCHGRSLALAVFGERRGANARKLWEPDTRAIF